MNGIINVYKEQGFTSHDVVAKLRGILHTKKIGHTGTLDPDATGVLPVCVGRATKVCSLLTDKDKTYEAVVKLGVTTDTQDMTGTVLRECPVDVTEERIREAVTSFLGEIDQIPPMYSAIKVGGKKLYELARQGKEVERKPRKVTIYELQLSSIDRSEQEFTMKVTCSKGTYIRTLCHDIGKKLGCGAAMKHLVRTRVGDFLQEEALTLGEIEERVKTEGAECLLRPIDSLFMDDPKCVVGDSSLRLLQNGNPVKPSLCSYRTPGENEQVRMYDETGDFYGIYRYHASDKLYRVVKMFHE